MRREDRRRAADCPPPRRRPARLRHHTVHLELPRPGEPRRLRPRRPRRHPVQRRVDLHRLHHGVCGAVRQGPRPHTHGGVVQWDGLRPRPHRPVSAQRAAAGDQVAARDGAGSRRPGRSHGDLERGAGLARQVCDERPSEQDLPRVDGDERRRVLLGHFFFSSFYFPRFRKFTAVAGFGCDYAPHIFT